MHRETRRRDVLTLLLVGAIGLVALIANPGYFSHDEWQKYDHYLTHGWWHYVQQYGQVRVGSGFGTPVRPLAFLVQGVHSLFFQSHPFLVHLMSAANTVAVGIALYFGCLHYGLQRRAALLAAGLFILNPMTTLATGWAAALMDQMYLSFGLAALYLADRYIRDGRRGLPTLLFIAVAGMAAVLSKETGIVLPATLLLPLALVPGEVVPRWRRLLAAGAAWGLPILAYLVFRATAIQSSFHAGQSDPYAASLRHVADNLFVYWLYPFHPLIGEAVTWQFRSAASLWAAFGAHCLLLAAVARCFGVRLAGLYLVFYFVFLLPVLFIPQKGAHYLFASAIVVSVAVGALAARPGVAARALGLLLGAVLLYHGLRFQGEIYKAGRCMERIAITLEASHARAGYPQHVYFTTEPGAPTHLLLRLGTGRNQIGSRTPVDWHLAELDKPPQDAQALVLHLDGQCLLTPAGAGR